MKTILTIIILTFALTMFCCKSANNDAKAQANSNPVTNVTNNKNTNQQSNSVSNNGKVIALTTESFKNQIFDYTTNKTWSYKGKLPAIIDFYADWCRPCKMIAPIMEELAVEYNGKVNFYKLNVDENSEVASVFGVSSIPAVLFIPVGAQPQMSIGAMPKESYIQAIKQVLLK